MHPDPSPSDPAKSARTTGAPERCERIDHDPTPSPSTGWREIAEYLHAPGAHTHGEPVDAAVCGAYGCHEREGLHRVTHRDGRPRVVCPDHAADLPEREVTA